MGYLFGLLAWSLREALQHYCYIDILFIVLMLTKLDQMIALFNCMTSMYDVQLESSCGSSSMLCTAWVQKVVGKIDYAIMF